MDNNNLIKRILQQELKQKNLLYPFIGDLSKREVAILKLRSGNEKKKTLQFVGKKFRITRERARQIETKAKIKIEFQNRIIDVLAKRFDECLFDEKEVEKAFTNYLSKSIKKYSTRKLEWLIFNKLLWKNKGV